MNFELHSDRFRFRHQISQYSKNPSIGTFQNKNIVYVPVKLERRVKHCVGGIFLYWLFGFIFFTQPRSSPMVTMPPPLAVSYTLPTTSSQTQPSVWFPSFLSTLFKPTQTLTQFSVFIYHLEAKLFKVSHILL